MKPSKTLICPHCGCERAIKPYLKSVFSSLQNKSYCLSCGGLISNPRWFDILRWFGLFLSLYIISVLSSATNPDFMLGYTNIFLCIVIYWHILAPIALFFIPLKADIDSFRKWDKRLGRMPKLSCPKCGCAEAISAEKKRSLVYTQPHHVAFKCSNCGAKLKFDDHFVLALFVTIVPTIFFAFKITDILVDFFANSPFVPKNIIVIATITPYIILVFYIVSIILVYFIEFEERD